MSSNGGGGAPASTGGRGGVAASTGGRAAAIGGNGGSGTGGASANGGSTGNAGASGQGSSDQGSSGSEGGLCKAIGWATRSGRTGGAVEVTGGGSATPVVVKSFSELQMYATDDQARVIYIDGTLGSGWSGTSGDRLEIESNKTIVGMRSGTELKAPLHIKDASNVIVRNIVIHGPGSNSDQAWDNLNIEGTSKNIWIDHCEFWDGQDGNADVVKGADTVTFTWNIFGYKQPNHM